MYDEDIIRPEIGSHEGRELTLMLAVEKPVVMFSDVTPPHRLLSQKNCLRLTSKVVGWRGVIS